MSMRVAVADVGSNTIKLLVAERAPDGTLREVESRTLDVRISAGIGSGTPELSPASMDRGLAAIEDLAADARRHGAERIRAVATSAVRDAANGAAFRARVRERTGIELNILSGPEEARLIGLGLTTDPALAHLRDFNVYDLGGGSLECICFRDRQVEQAVSLPLGCVRLTEKFVADPSAPFTGAEGLAEARHVEATLRASGFPTRVEPMVAVVGCGGTVTTSRAILGAESGLKMAQAPSRVEVASLRRIFTQVSALDLAQRRRVPGLNAARADVFPTALATLLTLADLGGFDAFQHSLRNLRWGLAASLLG